MMMQEIPYKNILLLINLFFMIMLMNSALAFNAFKFAVIADPHLSVPGPHSPVNGVKMFKNSVELLQATVDAINQVGDIDFVVVLGDLTKDAEPWNVDRFKEVMDELNMPWYVILGNHDISPVDTQATDREPGVTRATIVSTFQGHGFNGTQPNWSLDPLPGIHLIGLDSILTGDWGGRINRHGLNFLKQDLTAHADKLTIVILHHQLQIYTPAEQTGENGFDKFVLYNANAVKAILKQHPQVIMTLSGHRHLSTRYLQEDHIAYFTMDSTVTWPMRYTIFAVDPKQITYNTYDVPCNPKVREEARQNTLAVDTKTFPRTQATPNTPQGNQQLLDTISSEETKSGKLSLLFQPGKLFNNKVENAGFRE
jgi:Icc protein